MTPIVDISSTSLTVAIVTSSAELLSVSRFETALSASVSVDATAVVITPYLYAFLSLYSTISTSPLEVKFAKPVYRKVYRTYILKYH